MKFDSSGNRWQIDTTGSISQGEQKVKLFTHNFALLSYNYDIRVAAARETRLSIPSHHVHMISERVKHRTTYSHPRKQLWHVDWTEVSTKNLEATSISVAAGGTSESETEVEFEMSPAHVLEWLSLPAEEAAQYRKKIVSELLELIDLTIPHNSEEPDLSGVMRECDPSLRAKAVATMLQVKAGADGFIGSMPINLVRQELAVLRRDRYFVTEKSDGLRFLLVVIEDEKAGPVALLVNRSMVMFEFVGCQFIGAVLGPRTVLDGELVYNLSMKTHVFLVFDVLATSKRSYVHDLFHRRVDLIYEVLERYNSAYTTAPPHLNLVRKVFFDKSELSTLLKSITISGDKKVYLDPTNTRRHHKTDGVIFQPDTPYVCGRDDKLLKWKWADLCSVDLIARCVDRRVQLLCHADREVEVNCSKRGELGLFDSYRIKGDMADPSLPHSTPRIAEVTYRTDFGQWSYMHLRADKVKPNFIVTVMSTFLEQAEAISKEELEYNLLACTGEEMDFKDQLQQRLKDLLQERRDLVRQRERK